MTCAGCNFIDTHPVLLHDGTQVCGSCEAWRRECEARAITRLPGVEQRRAWLEDLEKKRGKPAVDALRETIKALWVAKA